MGSERVGTTVLINRVCCKEESFRPRLTVNLVLDQQFQDNHESTFEQCHQNDLFIGSTVVRITIFDTGGNPSLDVFRR
jgi:hypothetical protein